MHRRSFISGLAATAAMAASGPALAAALPAWDARGPRFAQMKAFWSALNSDDLAPMERELSEVDLIAGIHRKLEAITGLQPPFLIRFDLGDLIIHGVGDDPNMVIMLDGQVRRRHPALLFEFTPAFYRAIHGGIVTDADLATKCRDQMPIHGRRVGAVTRDGELIFEPVDGYHSCLHRSQLNLRRDLEIAIEIKGKGDTKFWIERDQSLAEEVMRSLASGYETPVTVFRQEGKRRYLIGGEFRWRNAPLAPAA